jgi:putative membrane protein
MTHKRYFLVLSIIFAIQFLVLSVAPYNRADWALENVLVVVFIIIMAISYKTFPLSRISYSLIFVFVSLHEIGAHYTYANVPYDSLIMSSFNFSLNESMGWSRNQFDRLVHFAYGLLLAYPIRELYCRIADTKGFWSYFSPINFILATSMIYELIEWGAAGLFGGDLGMAYLGTQGDVWDAHKDMALAGLGAFIAMTITLCINISIRKGFSDEWTSSLKIKSNTPLGEDEISRLRNQNKEK